MPRKYVKVADRQPTDTTADAAQPIKRTLPTALPAKELHTADLPDPQLPEIDTATRGAPIKAIDKPFRAPTLNPDQAGFKIVGAATPELVQSLALTPEYLSDLAFMEEPIQILIEPSDEENAPLVVDCWVNGKGAEVLDTLTGKFMEINCLPIGSPITTKRKYVEVLARSREERVSTQETNPRPGSGEDGWKLRRNMRRKAVFSVLSDPNPAGRAWLTRLMAER